MIIPTRTSYSIFQHCRRTLKWCIFPHFGCVESRCLTVLLTNQTWGAILYHYILLSPDDSSTEPQTHNRLSVGCSLVIMPYSPLLNTLQSHLLHSQPPLCLLICCSMPYRWTASTGPESLTGTKQILSVLRTGIDGCFWTFNFCFFAECQMRTSIVWFCLKSAYQQL